MGFTGRVRRYTLSRDATRPLLRVPHDIRGITASGPDMRSRFPLSPRGFMVVIDEEEVQSQTKD